MTNEGSVLQLYCKHPAFHAYEIDNGRLKDIYHSRRN
jgi:hypothetical protein